MYYSELKAKIHTKRESADIRIGNAIGGIEFRVPKHYLAPRQYILNHNVITSSLDKSALLPRLGEVIRDGELLKAQEAHVALPPG